MCSQLCHGIGTLRWQSLLSGDNNYIRMIVAIGHHGASVALPETAVPAGFDLVADKEAAAPRKSAKRTVYRAAAMSLALHLTVLALFLFRFTQAPSPELGVEAGLPQNLNVSVITEADLKSLSMDPPREEVSLPSPAAPAETPPTKEPPREDSSPPKSTTATHTPDDPSGLIARATEAFASSMTQAFVELERRKAARPSPQMPSNLHFYRPAASHSGKSDEFARAVAWALAATKPQGNGTWGSTVVTFIVSPSGQLQELRLLRSSGDNWLDTGALMAVKQARLPTPPSGLPPGDRTFNVEYISSY
jgi:periplasmic protein TonB